MTDHPIVVSKNNRNQRLTGRHRKANENAINDFRALNLPIAGCFRAMVAQPQANIHRYAGASTQDLERNTVSVSSGIDCS